jgi:periplasmic copper chaperone A
MKRRLFLSLFLSPTFAHAHSLKKGNIAIGHAWAMPSNDQQTQVFMPILNTANKADALLSARCDIAGGVELRLNDSDAPLTSFDLQPNLPLAMRPTARHIGLRALSKSLQTGDRIQLILLFKNAGEIAVDVYVEATPGE